MNRTQEVGGPNPPSSTTFYSHRHFHLAAICLVSFLVYLNSFGVPFLWDDYALIVDNQFVKSWSHVGDLFRSRFGDGYLGDTAYPYVHYRPLTTFSFLINHTLLGGGLLGYHGVNILLHALNGILFYMIASFFVSRPAAFLSVLFFTVHPIHTGAITYIGSRGDVLYSFFFLLGFYLFLKWRDSGRGIFWLGVMLSFCFSLLSKEIAVMFPFLCLGYTLCFKSPLRRKEILWEMTLLIPLGAYLFFRFFVIPFHRFMFEDSLGFGWKILSAAPLLFSYLRLLFWPHPLYIGRSAFQISPSSPWGAWAETFLSWTVLCTTIFLFRKRRKALFAISWVFISSVPLVNFLSGVYPSMSENRFYIPSMGFFALAGTLGVLAHQKAFSDSAKSAIRILGITLFSVFGLLTVLRNADYRSPWVFYTQILRYAPDSWRVRGELGYFYFQRGFFKKAKKEFIKAKKLRPEVYHFASGLGAVYLYQGDYQKALSEFNEAIALNRGFSSKDHLWRARTFYSLGRYEDAKKDLSLVEAASRPKEDFFAKSRHRMVDSQLRLRGIRDEKVLGAMEKVPRHLFVPESIRNAAYRDGPLPIGEDQTISQPYIVALMTELLELTGKEKVLEIGTGSGYQAAVLAEIVPEVYTIEILPALSERASRTLKDLGYQNIHIRTGNGYLGWPEEAPFDAIIVTAAPEFLPHALVEQLKEGGVLVIPVGPPHDQVLWQIRKHSSGLKKKTVIPVSFVPMVEPVP